MGAIAGKKEYMEMIAPSGSVYQAGTFNGNPISITAGLATLKQLDQQFYSDMNSKGKNFREGIRNILEDKNLNYQVAGVSSMFQIYLTDKTVWNYDDAKTADTDKFETYFKTLLKEGVFVPPSQFECCFLSKMHDAEDIDKTLNIIDTAMKQIKD